MSAAPIVNVAQGALRGKAQQAVNGGRFYAFLGIPYAKPPVGNLRFKAPEPPQAWTGIRDARRLGPRCAQIDLMQPIPFNSQYTGEEDCLFLNVYTPQLPGRSKDEIKKAVMVFVHGGGFICGSGDSDFYGPDLLVEEDVILVTFNYRLGPLGFLTTEDSEVPGNAGMKDQVAALQWIKQNIATFGGDPGNVTIFGESAGGAAVHYLLLSTMARGLFHRAISQSGCALNQWATSTSGRARTLRLAHALGCKSEHSKEILAFLKKVPVKELVEKQYEALTPEEARRSKHLKFPFVPTCDGGFKHNEQVFLSAPVIDILKSGKYNKLPYITGFNSNEGIEFLQALEPDKLTSDEQDFQALLPTDTFPDIDISRSADAAKKMKEFYFKGGNSQEEFALMMGDLFFVYKIHETVRQHAKHTTSAAPLYYYQFLYDGQLGVFKKMLGLQNVPGVCHGDELCYLFSMEVVDQDRDKDSTEMKVRTLMLQLWTSFAKKGIPSTPEVTWSPVTSGSNCCLKIDEESAMEEEVEPERIHFWDELNQAG